MSQQIGAALQSGFLEPPPSTDIPLQEGTTPQAFFSDLTHYNCCGCALHAESEPRRRQSCETRTSSIRGGVLLSPPASTEMNNAAADTFRTASYKVLGATLVCLPSLSHRSSRCCSIKASEKVPFVQCVANLMKRGGGKCKNENKNVKSVHVQREQ